VAETNARRPTESGALDLHWHKNHRVPAYAEITLWRMRASVLRSPGVRCRDGVSSSLFLRYHGGGAQRQEMQP